jgi:murein DD-endopeptidase MepM/ murein hydrolase activator NlpD
MKANSGICKSRFSQILVRENRLDKNGFETWAFMPGMLFLATRKWWGDGGERTRPHEGTDFGLYVDAEGRVVRLEEGTRVPVMYDGVIAGIIDDFLGKSVIVAHGSSEAGIGPFLTIYGHTVPFPDLAVGATVGAGRIIATIGSRKGVAVFPHLHISVGRATGLIPHEQLDWKNMESGVAMSDPLDLILDGPYRLLPQG